ncbi:GAF domain-containing protein [Maribacter caenipelagi]|uniref:histidine kinase n=1 Tax=Maribacter caenipelagi TaxID=1447781 RepID=A0A4R7DGD6_9FLAO|nr:ATP-binding protein [Maribacter caenipelagi]TDS20649.1 GAF domain-containing protein [Maribacter caenipelagi]
MIENFNQTIQDVQSIIILPTILDVIVQSTGLGFAVVARVTSDKWITCASRDNLQFGLAPGDELDIKATFCRDVRSTNTLVVIDHVDQDKQFFNNPIPIQYGFQSYISVPIILQDGTFFGTLCALDPTPNKLNNSKVIGMFTSYAELISFHLDAIEKLRLKDLEIKKKNFQLESFDFVSSHDIQEPLRKIQMFSSVIQEKNNDGLTTEIKKYLDGIKNESQRMRNILNDLLVFSEYKKSSQEFVATNLNSIIENIRKRLLKEFSECNGKIVVEKLPTVPIMPDQIEQLFYNLIINSITFRSNNCDLEISISSRIEKGIDLTNEKLEASTTYCALTFTDNGTGFDPRYNEKIFGMFNRLDKEKDYKSTGIGLTIARRITENHNGFIIANGNLNKGASFTVYLPMKQ